MDGIALNRAEKLSPAFGGHYLARMPAFGANVNAEVVVSAASISDFSSGTVRGEKALRFPLCVAML